MIWRLGFCRVRRANDRESLRAERKAQQNAEGERLHTAVSLCIICAMEKSKLRRAQRLKHHRQARRAGDFETTRAGKSKATAFRSMFTPLTERKLAGGARLSIFLYNQIAHGFRFGIFAPISNCQSNAALFRVAIVAEFWFRVSLSSNATILSPGTRLRRLAFVKLRRSRGYRAAGSGIPNHFLNNASILLPRA
jgi:hypothetical protein